VKRIASFFAIDKSIALNLFGRGWQSFAGIITLYAIGRYLTLVEQGFYFTFLSVLGLQVFFELGLGYVILQFASHEVAHLTWGKKGLLKGNMLAKKRLSSLFRYTLIWGLIVSLLIMAIIFPGGQYFFSNHLGDSEGNILWDVPWFLVCFFSSALALVNIIFCYLEGCGLVREIAGVRAAQYILASIVMWVLLKLGGRLYSLSLMIGVSTFVGFYYLFFFKKEFLMDIFKSYQNDIKIDWVRELWPLQWRIAVSWVSGYVVFQLASPIAFAYQSPQVAAQIGMSIAIAMALISFPIAWMSTKANQFGGMVARKEYKRLDKDFYFAMRSSILIALVLVFLICIANNFLYEYKSIYANRVLQPGPFLILMLSSVVNYISYGLAFYLRAFKEEPLLVNSIAGAAISIIGLYICTKYFGVNEIVSFYLGVSIFLLFLTIKKFIEKKRIWRV
jgi:Na+-driven multidrug efflux pump